ncbi:MAG: hypothetical protein FWE46_00135 [Coriobacteriia bacterium]|nr:hypothetical protein [Coriobacteriia bacterium]MCL2536810.1 hypothetical protein [Coriobacteriia bacterium]
MKYFQQELDASTQGASALVDALRQVKVLYTDIDGTVLGKRGCLLVDGDNAPCADTAVAIVEANVSPDFAVVPCTGRSVTQLIEISRLLGWDDFIGEAGAVRSYWNAASGTRENCYDTPGWSIELQAQLSEDNTPLDVINASGAMERLFEAFPGQIEYHSPWNVNRQATNVLRGRVDPVQATELFTDLEVPITLIENGVIAPSAHTLIDDGQPVRAYHLAPTGASKGAAIAADLKRRGLRREQALMVGDGMADLECAPEVAAIFMLSNALHSPRMAAAMEQLDNAYLVEGAQGTGWAQLVRAILASKQGR